MKIKEGFILKQIMEDYIVVPTGEDLVNFDAMITLNESGAFLWKLLLEEQTEEQLCDALCAEYDVSREQAMEDLQHFLKMLQSAKVLV